MTRRSRRTLGIRTLVAACAIAVAGAVAAHTEMAGDLQIIHPWAEAGVDATVVHPTLVNEGTGTIEIVGVMTQAARQARFVLHGEDVARLRLDPGATLAPDVLAIHLDGLGAPVVEEDHFALTLVLADGRHVIFHVVVGEMSTMMERQEEF